MERNKYVYRHRRSDTNEIFYVGLGKGKRAYNRNGRNKNWKEIAHRCDYSVEILASDLTHEEACELEILLISLYGRIDLGTGCLVNMTTGGDGMIELSADSIQKMKETKTGKYLCKENKKSKKAIDIVTLQVFDCINEGANHYGVSPGDFCAMLKGKVYNKTTAIYFDEYDIHKDYSIPIRRVTRLSVVDTYTQLIYDNISQVSTKFNISKKKLRDMLMGRVKNTTSFLYYRDYTEKSPKYESSLGDFKNEKLSPKGKDNNKSKEIINFITFEVFETMCKTAAFYGRSRSNIARMLKGEIPNSLNLILSSDYDSTKQYIPWDNKKYRKGKKTKNTLTGKVYDCLRKASEELGIELNKLRNMLSGAQINTSPLVRI